MRALISEDAIEQAILSRLKDVPFNYDILICDPSPDKLNAPDDGTFRLSKKECVLPKVLHDSLWRINAGRIDEKVIAEKVRELRKDFTGTDMVDTNYNLYKKLRDGIKVEFVKDGKNTFDFLRLIDFDNPENNTFTAVSQMWIQGPVYPRRPDILIFINGLPIVFIELKKSTVKVKEAYNKNLQDYRRDIPNLFAFNQICVLSNGLETRLGAFNAGYDNFFEWLKVSSEKEVCDRNALRKPDKVGESSVKYFIEGLLDKQRLLDYIENFILFQNQSVKIIAKNHQYLGVNNLMESVNNRQELRGKLGVFWHTQGSGKSFSMVMFVRKVRRKIQGNFSFLIITDRDDLDKQIYKNFVRTEVIGAKDECRPKNSEQLRTFLQSNKPFIFSLIHKFRPPMGKQYPLLTERDDIFVLVDEAHRTQYKDLAENMRRGLPNANYIAFTGTPLLGAQRLTNQWFGDYVSEYNFAQAVEDGSTVPLFYSRRVPEVGLQNDFLDDDLTTIIEEENLNFEESTRLTNSAARVLEVIKREERLDRIAQDIAHHFPRRGFLGKGMVVSVDKFTAVRMYDKVQYYWQIEKKNITKERNAAKTKEERDKLTAILDYMNKVEMAVIISEDADEDEKFAQQNLNVSEHRIKMNTITTDGKDIEDRFKDTEDNLQLVFVCAMWLTGFDVPKLSTLYLDKPMKGHTLMQAIARANRVYENKPCGIVVDYVNVFKYMKRALSEYATGEDGGEYPAKDIDKLIEYIEATVEEADVFLAEQNINLDEMLIKYKNLDALDKVEELRQAYNIIVDKEDTKERFKVILNTLMNLYEAAKPEIFERHWKNEKAALLKYLYGLFYNLVNDERLERARVRMAVLLDTSVMADEPVVCESGADYVIHNFKVINLAKIDVDDLRKELRHAEYKAVEIEDLKAFLEKALEQMMARNCTRGKFSERYRRIIDSYNAGGSENEDYYEQLVKLMEELKKEDSRASAEGLSDEELELYDLLIAGKKLTKAEEQKVKLSAKNLYKKLTENHSRLFVVDWYKDERPFSLVKSAVEEALDEDLPEGYDKTMFEAKVDLILKHFVDMAVQGYGWIGKVA